MIAHLKGNLQKKTPHGVVIDNAGIGYEVIVPLSTFYALPEEGERVGLHIYTHVREDAITLFGFHRPLEKEIFMLLISVSGIGPKLAINILSGIGPEELLDAMAGGDAARMQSIPGVGKKTAERIALELREKALQMTGGREPYPFPASPDDDRKTHEDAVSALINLGYPAKSARAAVDRARRAVQEASLEALIKEALRILV
ncbi:MAG: Holliday junction branch migration protein RuvA [Deltaproteobacteria bacterium]|jgi:Holliday junction DNA helicase RuvA